MDGLDGLDWILLRGLVQLEHLAVLKTIIMTNCATSCFEIMKSWPRERSSVLTKIGEASPQLEKSFLINIYVERERAAKF